MRRRFVAFAFVLALASVATAQDYRFEVPTLDLQVYVEGDASVRLVYDITFINQPGAHPIDVVDVGLPKPGWDLSTMSASLDGVAVHGISRSSYVDGIEVPLGAETIAPGEQGTLHFECSIPDLVFRDTTRSDYASLRITPTWYGPEFVVGSGVTRLAVHLPEDVQPDEALHHGQEFQKKLKFQGRTVVYWEWNEPAVREHLVGVSFPDRSMVRVVEISKRELLRNWIHGHGRIFGGLMLAFAILFGVLFFRFTGGTGCCLFVPMLGAFGLFLALAAEWLPLAVPALVGAVVFNERHLKKRRGKYLPAIAEVEGGGIKRGLTAPEAAALLELPLNRVLTLVLFGLLKKRVLLRVVEEDDPEEFRVEIAPPFEVPVGEDRARWLRKAAQEQGTVVHKYEGPFLELIQTEWNTPVTRLDFGPALKRLVQSIADRMKGFDLDETQAYYRHIIKKALWEARNIPDLQVRSEFLDEKSEWILMGDDYDDVFRHGGHYYRPTWYQPLPRSSSSSSSTPAPPSGGSFVPKFSDVSASFAGWAENTAGNLAGAIAPGSIKVPEASGGFIDLSGLDRVSKSVFDAMASGSGGGGGGGGCACACAGCACACACAGGGR